jgi:transcriptional regulator with XRE-family HTH domain
MLGEELRKARRAAGLSQEALALRARVDRSYLSELERDLKSPTVKLLLRLCNTLGISASGLIAKVEKTTKTGRSGR